MLVVQSTIAASFGLSWLSYLRKADNGNVARVAKTREACKRSVGVWPSANVQHLASCEVLSDGFSAPEVDRVVAK